MRHRSGPPKRCWNILEEVKSGMLSRSSLKLMVLTDANSITVICKDLFDSQIADNYIGSLLDQPENCEPE